MIPLSHKAVPKNRVIAPEDVEAVVDPQFLDESDLKVATSYFCQELACFQIPNQENPGRFVTWKDIQMEIPTGTLAVSP
jgi:hypothetical protein